MTGEVGATLLSPIRESMHKGEARLLRTVHVPRPRTETAEILPAEPAPEPTISQPWYELDDLPDDLGSPPLPIPLSPHGLRKRTAAPIEELEVEFIPLPKIPKPKPKQKDRVNTKSCRAPRAKDLPAGATSRIGESNGRGGVYTREAYDGAASAKLPTQLRNLEAQLALTAQTQNMEYLSRINSLTSEVSILTAANLSLTAQLAAQVISSATDMLNARLEERGLTASAVNLSFQKGMNAAIRIRKDQEIHCEPEACFSKPTPMSRPSTSYSSGSFQKNSRAASDSE